MGLVVTWHPSLGAGRGAGWLAQSSSHLQRSQCRGLSGGPVEIPGVPLGIKHSNLDEPSDRGRAPGVTLTCALKKEIGGINI